jgi:hypothetical protein
MDPCWKNLPIELAERICNMLPRVRSFDQPVLNDIKNQTHLFNKYYWHVASLFGFDDVWYAMYDDMRNISDILDTHPEDMCIENVVFEMWKSMRPDQRKEIVVHY